MKIDELGCLITDEIGPGKYGDSAAETSRLRLIYMVLGESIKASRLMLSEFINNEGVVRHPYSRYPVDDTSEDQKLPLYLAIDATNDLLLDYYKSKDGLWWLKRFVGTRLFVQALIFKFPWRWDDGKKSWQPSEDSSCDYLNFCAQVLYKHLKQDKNVLTCLAMVLIPKDVAKRKIFDYYANNLDGNRWVIDLYNRAIDQAWEGIL